MTTLSTILVGLLVWTIVALVFGLGLGSVLRFCARYDGLGPVHVRQQAKKTA